MKHMKFIAFAMLVLGTACASMIAGIAFPTPIALLVLLCAVGMDFLTTYMCLRVHGTEANPAVAFLLKKIGIRGTFCVMACIWACIIMFRWLPSAQVSQTAVALAYVLVPINNLIVLRRLKRKHTSTPRAPRTPRVVYRI